MEKEEIEALRKAFNLKDCNGDDTTHEEVSNKKVNMSFKEFYNKILNEIKELFKEEPKIKQRAEFHLIDGEIITVEGYFKNAYDAINEIDGTKPTIDGIRYGIVLKQIKYIKLEDIKGDDEDV